MRLRQLEYFVAICECGSYTKAASQMYVAQPSMSQQIRALEDELGARLLDRTPQGIRLTLAGEAYLPEARKVLAAVERSRAIVRNVVAGVNGELIVSTVRSVAANVLPCSVSAWHARYPDTVLTLRDFNHRKLLESAIEAGEGDVGVGPRPKLWSGPVCSIGYEEIVVVSRDALALNVTSSDISQLSGRSWVLFETTHGLTELIEMFCQKYGIDPHPVARSAQVEAALSMSLDGIGITMLPQNVVPAELRPGHTVRAGDGVFRELVAYTKDESSSWTRRYISLLSELDLPLIQHADLPPGALIC